MQTLSRRIHDGAHVGAAVTVSGSTSEPVKPTKPASDLVPTRENAGQTPFAYVTKVLATALYSRAM